MFIDTKALKRIVINYKPVISILNSLQFHSGIHDFLICKFLNRILKMPFLLSKKQECCLEITKDRNLAENKKATAHEAKDKTIPTFTYKKMLTRIKKIK